MSSDAHSSAEKSPSTQPLSPGALADLTALLAAAPEEPKPPPVGLSATAAARRAADLALAEQLMREPTPSAADGAALTLPSVAPQEPTPAPSPLAVSTVGVLAEPHATPLEIAPAALSPLPPAPLPASGVEIALAALAANEPSLAPAPPPVEPTPPPTNPPPTKAQSFRFERRHFAWLLLALAVVGLLLFALWYAFSSGLLGESNANRPPPTPRALILQDSVAGSSGVPAVVVTAGVDPQFAAFYASNGGERRFGKPLGPLTNVNGRAIQWFERARLEYVPAQANTPTAIQIGLVGSEYTQNRSFDRPAPFTSRPGLRYFGETGHSLGGRFLDYWERNGGLALFGFPISEEVLEPLADGTTYRVQYFERARLEYHPDKLGTPEEIQVGSLGKLLQP